MSDEASTPIKQPKLSKANFAVRRRWPLYLAIAAAAVLVFAYIDAGEEPIHPIEQKIVFPAASGASE